MDTSRLQITWNKFLGNRRHSDCVFVIGSPRSGTSVLAWALAQHPDFWTSSESDFIYHLCGKGHLFSSYKKSTEAPDSWLNENKVSYEEYAMYIGEGIDRLFLSRCRGFFKKKRWIDNSPTYTLICDDLLKMFPNSKLLHIYRDGREVVNSMINSKFNEEWANDFTCACNTWVFYANLGYEIQLRYPDRVLGVSHKNIKLSTSSEVDNILDFLNVKSSNLPVDFLKLGIINSSYGNKKENDIKKIKEHSTSPGDKWRLWSDEQKTTFNSIAGPLMDKLGIGLS